MLSADLINSIAQLVAKANQDGVSAQDLTGAFFLALGTSTQTGTIWNADGVTDPNSNPRGLYRDSVLETFKSQLLTSGLTDAASYVKTWIASTPGANVINNPIIKVQIETDVSYANNVTVNPAEQGNCFEYSVTPGPLGPNIQREIDPITGLAKAIPDAMAAPRGCNSYDEVRAYFKQRIADYLAANSSPPAPGVDFSPANYKP